MTKIKVIIPAFNEADSITHVINDIPNTVDEVIVVSNNSTDNTEANAKKAGATVLKETNKGYGYACLKGMNHISKQNEKPDIIVFLDGDYSDYPKELNKIVAPIINDNIDFTKLKSPMAAIGIVKKHYDGVVDGVQIKRAVEKIIEKTNSHSSKENHLPKA